MEQIVISKRQIWRSVSVWQQGRKKAEISRRSDCRTLLWVRNQPLTILREALYESGSAAKSVKDILFGSSDVAPSRDGGICWVEVGQLASSSLKASSVILCPVAAEANREGGGSWVDGK